MSPTDAGAQRMDDLRHLGLLDWALGLRQIHDELRANTAQKLTDTIEHPPVDLTLFWDGPYSQWAQSPFRVTVPDASEGRLGMSFNCAEQFMMWAKARLFSDMKTERDIMTTHRPREQKALGRTVRDFDPARWDAVARDVVLIGNLAKFSQNSAFFVALGESRGVLVEASPFDRIWGIGLGADHPDARNPALWQGKNWLGICLTETRELLTGPLWADVQLILGYIAGGPVESEKKPVDKPPTVH